MIPYIKPNENPVLFDKLINQINIALVAGLPWLSNAFGRAFTIVKKLDNGEYLEPAIYINNNDYLSVLPSDELGNYSFITIADPQEYDNSVLNSKGVLKAKGSITLWLSLETIFADSSLYLSENVKLQILNIITKPGILSNGRITLLSIEEKAENIFKQYSIKQIDSQFLIHPYCGFKFNCEFKINEVCKPILS